MPTYARIAVNIPTLTGVFDYHLPSELNGRLGIGALVTVPFGKQTVQGVVVELIAEPSVPETKPVLDVLDAQPVLTPAPDRIFQTAMQNPHSTRSRRWSA